jgi:hypothetical protein
MYRVTKTILVDGDLHHEGDELRTSDAGTVQAMLHAGQIVPIEKESSDDFEFWARSVGIDTSKLPAEAIVALRKAYRRDLRMAEDVEARFTAQNSTINELKAAADDRVRKSGVDPKRVEELEREAANLRAEVNSLRAQLEVAKKPAEPAAPEPPATLEAKPSKSKADK